MIATIEPDVKNILSHIVLVFLLLTLNMSLTVNVPQQTSNLQKFQTEKKITMGIFLRTLVVIATFASKSTGA